MKARGLEGPLMIPESISNHDEMKFEVSCWANAVVDTGLDRDWSVMINLLSKHKPKRPALLGWLLMASIL